MTVVEQNPAAPRAHVEPAGPSLVVEGMSVREPAVVAEARRWTTGHRGPVVAVEDMSGADLSARSWRRRSNSRRVPVGCPCASHSRTWASQRSSPVTVRRYQTMPRHPRASRPGRAGTVGAVIAGRR